MSYKCFRLSEKALHKNFSSDMGRGHNPSHTPRFDHAHSHSKLFGFSRKKNYDTNLNKSVRLTAIIIIIIITYYLLTYLLACLLACLLAYLHAYLLTYLLTYSLHEPESFLRS